MFFVFPHLAEATVALLIVWLTIKAKNSLPKRAGKTMLFSLRESSSKATLTKNKDGQLRNACLRKPSPSNRGAEQRPRLWRNRAVRRLNEATSFASGSAAKRLCRIVDKVGGDSRSDEGVFSRYDSEAPSSGSFHSPPSPQGEGIGYVASKRDYTSKLT